MEIELPEGYEEPDESQIPLRYVPPSPAAGTSSAQHTAAEIFVAGQMKYNPIPNMVQGVQRYLGTDYQDNPDYNPFSDENLIDKAGYPMDLFVGSRSREEDLDRMERYEQELYVNSILETSGPSGVVSGVAAGLMNPLYLVPVLGWGGRGMSAGQRFVSSSAAAAGVETVSEAVLHGFQDSRTLDESVFNIMAASIATGVLGSVLPAQFSKAELESVEVAKKKLAAELKEADEIMTGESLLSPGQTFESLQEMADVARIGENQGLWGWTQRKLSKLTPLRVLASKNPLVRKLGASLGEQSVVGTSQSSIETLIKQWQVPLHEGITGVRSIYKNMVQDPRWANLKYDEFENLIAKAMRRGDKSPNNPFVDEAATMYRQKILGPLKKIADELGLLADDVEEVVGAVSYFPRVYNFDKLHAEADQFIRAIQDHLYAVEMLDDVTSAQIAQEVFQRLTHRSQTESLPRDITIQYGPLKGRTLNVPDSVLEPYLISEPEMVLSSWVRDMSAQIEFTKRFGDTGLDSFIDEADAEWVKMINKADNDKLRASYERERKNDMETLRALRDRLQTRYRIPDNPNSFWVKSGRNLRNLNILRLLGGMTLSAFPDLARPLYNHGFSTYAKAIKQLANPSQYKLVKADMQRMGVALDDVLAHRLRSIAQLDYAPTSKGTVTSVLDRMVSGRPGGGMDYGKLTLMTPWNVHLKLLSGLMAQDGLIAHVTRPVKFAKKLNKAGVSDDMARRMRDQFKKYGENTNGLRRANSDKWDDIEAAYLFENTVMKEVDATIVTPGVMDTPLWMSSEVGKVIGQLKSFSFASTNKQLLSNMNNFDGHFIQGVGAAITLGALTYNMKRALRDKEPETDPMMLLQKGLTYSGAIGFGSEMIDIGTNMMSAAGLVNADGNYKWAKQGLWGATLGPSSGLLEDAIRGSRVFFKDEPNEGDADALRRILPYQNLFYASKPLNAAQEAIENEMGIY